MRVPVWEANLGKRHVFEAVNQCIYCNTTGGVLTDEHTFPDGLGARQVLPKASCGECQGIINSIEGHCQLNFLKFARAQFGMQSTKRRKNVKPLTIDVKRHSGKIDRVVIDPSQMPLLLALPVIPPPTILANAAPKDKISGFWWLPNFIGAEPLRRLDAESVIFPRLDLPKFMRMIAKIAHAQTWAMIPDRFKPILPDIILGKTENWHGLVGGRLIVPNADDKYSHSFAIGLRRLEDGKIFVCAQIRLFAQIGAPVYEAVCGEWIP